MTHQLVYRSGERKKQKTHQNKAGKWPGRKAEKKGINPRVYACAMVENISSCCRFHGSSDREQT
jgi:hypothetical protein